MAANVKKLWGSHKSTVIASGVPEKNAEWFVLWALKFPHSIKDKFLEKRSVINIRQFMMEFSVACTKKQIRVGLWLKTTTHGSRRTDHDLKGQLMGAGLNYVTNERFNYLTN